MLLLLDGFICKFTLQIAVGVTEVYGKGVKNGCKNGNNRKENGKEKGEERRFPDMRSMRFIGGG
jgi:hypothetical protein